MPTLTREQFIDSMSALLARLGNEEIPVPVIYDWAPLIMTVQGDDVRARLEAAVRLLGCPFNATVRPIAGEAWLQLKGDIGGIPIQLSAPAEDVCERAVVGGYRVGAETVDRVEWIVPDTVVAGGAEVGA